MLSAAGYAVFLVGGGNTQGHGLACGRAQRVREIFGDDTTKPASVSWWRAVDVTLHAPTPWVDAGPGLLSGEGDAQRGPPLWRW
jgi:hypothetical protein